MQSARSGRASGSTAGRLSGTHRPHLVPRSLRNRGENAPSGDRFPAAAGPGTNVPRAEAGCGRGAGTGRRRCPAARGCARERVRGAGRAYKSHARCKVRPGQERLSWRGARRRGRRQRGPGPEREETGGGDASAGWRPPTLAAPLAPAGLRRRARAAAAAAASAACGGEAGLLLRRGRRLARRQWAGQGRAAAAAAR